MKEVDQTLKDRESSHNIEFVEGTQFESNDNLTSEGIAEENEVNNEVQSAKVTLNVAGKDYIIDLERKKQKFLESHGQI